MLDTTPTAIVLVKDWLGQSEIEELELQEEQGAEEDDGGVDDDLYQQSIGRPKKKCLQLEYNN